MNKLIPAFAFLLMSASAFAQGGSTQSPPAPSGSESAPQPANSVPSGAGNMNTGSASNPNAGGSVSTTVVSPGATASPVPAAPAGTQPMANTVPVPASR